MKWEVNENGIKVIQIRGMHWFGDIFFCWPQVQCKFADGG